MPSEYWETVKGIAEEIKKDHPYPDEYNEQRIERVREDVDGSSWIIYSDHHEEVLRETENPPDGDVVEAVAGPGKDWEDMQRTAAFLAMEGDVFMVLSELDEATRKKRSRKDWDPRT